MHFYRGAHARQRTGVIYDPTIALAGCIETLRKWQIVKVLAIEGPADACC